MADLTFPSFAAKPVDITGDVNSLISQYQTQQKLARAQQILNQRNTIAQQIMSGNLDDKDTMRALMGIAVNDPQGAAGLAALYKAGKPDTPSAYQQATLDQNAKNARVRAAQGYITALPPNRRDFFISNPTDPEAGDFNRAVRILRSNGEDTGDSGDTGMPPPAVSQPAAQPPMAPDQAQPITQPAAPLPVPPSPGPSPFGAGTSLVGTPPPEGVFTGAAAATPPPQVAPQPPAGLQVAPGTKPGELPVGNAPFRTASDGKQYPVPTPDKIKQFAQYKDNQDAIAKFNGFYGPDANARYMGQAGPTQVPTGEVETPKNFKPSYEQYNLIKTGKMALPSEAAKRVNLVTAAMDETKKSAQKLLDNPDLDKAVGGLPQAMAEVNKTPAGIFTNNPFALPGMGNVLSSRDEHGNIITPSYLKGTGVANVQAAINSLKNQVSLAIINNMKEMSKSGSTNLGRVMQVEYVGWQNALGSLDPNQDPAAYRENLKNVINYISQSQARIRKGFYDDYGGS